MHGTYSKLIGAMGYTRLVRVKPSRHFRDFNEISMVFAAVRLTSASRPPACRCLSCFCIAYELKLRYQATAPLHLIALWKR